MNSILSRVQPVSDAQLEELMHVVEFDAIDGRRLPLLQCLIELKQFRAANPSRRDHSALSACNDGAAALPSAPPALCHAPPPAGNDSAANTAGKIPLGSADVGLSPPSDSAPAAEGGKSALSLWARAVSGIDERACKQLDAALKHAWGQR